jgi:hypothetical protein
VANAPGTVAALWVLTSFGLCIGDLDCSPIEDGTSGDNLTRQGQWCARPDILAASTME